MGHDVGFQGSKKLIDPKNYNPRERSRAGDKSKSGQSF